MKRRAGGAVKLIVSLCLLAFIVSTMWTVADRLLRPEIYEVNSAPWYTEVLINGTLCLVCAGASWLVGLAVDAIEKKREEKKKKDGE